MSHNKLNEGQLPSYQAITETPKPQEAPPKYEPTPYPPQGAYSAQHTDVHVNVNTNQPIIVDQQEFGPYSKVITCPNCQASISTSLDYKAGRLTWLLSILICVFGCGLGCFLIPFCVNDVRDVKHTCPSCGHFVGLYKRMG